MSFLDRWRHRLRARLNPEAVRHERDAEVAFHLSLGAMHAERDGMSADDARRAARKSFGNVTATKEGAREISRAAWLDALLQDLRYAARTLRRAPGFTIGAALTLALGIGATTTVFSIFDSAVLRAVPYGDASRLYIAIERKDGTGQRTLSYPTFNDWVDDAATWKGSLDGMAFIRGRAAWLDAAGGAERVIIANVAPHFFEIMQTRPYLGRTFLPEEESAGSERVAVVAFDAWRRYYGGDTDIVGRVVAVDSAPTRIIGVMPPRFAFPQWASGRFAATGIWMPIAHIEHTDAPLRKRGDHADSRVVVRVSASSDSARATTALAGIAARIATAHPAEAAGWTRIDLFGVRDGAIGNAGRLLRTLGGAAGLVLLLACVNVANLSFVRGAARARELAVRAALGAGRLRVIRQLVTESLVVAAIGCGIGLVLAVGLVNATRVLAVNQLAGAEYLRVNLAMLGFAIAASVFAAVAAAIVPAVRMTRAAPVRTIRSGAQSALAGRGDARIRGALVVVQLAVAVVLLVGTSLLVQSFRNAAGVPLGYDPNGVITTRISPPARYAQAADALMLYQTLIERVAATPGVTDVGFISATQMTTAVAVGSSAPQSDMYGSASPLYRTTSAGYQRAMGMQMAAGNWFTEEDMRLRERFVINEALARSLFPDGPAVGQRITALRASRERPDYGQPVTGAVVGVVRDGGDSPAGPPPPTIYVPFTLETWPWGGLAVRTTAVAATIPLIRDVIRSVDPAIPEARATAGFSGVAAMASEQSAGLARRRLMLTAIGAFAIASLVLAAVGLYSVISYSVSQRTREVGVRIALGATNSNILKMVMGEGTRLAALGVVLGAAGALGVTQLIRAMLFQTTTTDVPTYLVAAGVLLVTAAIACYIPARRASRLSPTEAIRGE